MNHEMSDGNSKLEAFLYCSWIENDVLWVLQEVELFGVTWSAGAGPCPCPRGFHTQLLSMRS